MALGFSGFELRTTDVPAAEEFYKSLLGGSVGKVVPLSPQAAAHGAPPHWVGYLAVANLASALQKILQTGAKFIGSSEIQADDVNCLTLKGAGGEVIGITSGGVGASADRVGFYQLLAPDAAKAINDYREIFGWKVFPSRQSDAGFPYHLIGENQSQSASGMVLDTSSFPGSHPHWLYYFRVTDLDKAVTQVRSREGEVTGLYKSPLGREIAVCHDPQGAAFGLVS